MKTQFEEQLVCYSKQRMYLFTKAGDSIFMTTVLGIVSVLPRSWAGVMTCRVKSNTIYNKKKPTAVQEVKVFKEAH